MIGEVQEKIRETGIIPLSVETLPLLRAGMYWYEGDEFSWKLLPDKTLKSVVLLIKGQTIYGDGFVEKTKSKDCSEKQIDHQLLTIFEHSLMAETISDVNRGLEKAEKPLWNGTYLTASNCACYDVWTIFYPSGLRSKLGFRGAGKVRRIIKCFVM